MASDVCRGVDFREDSGGVVHVVPEAVIAEVLRQLVGKQASVADQSGPRLDAGGQADGSATGICVVARVDPQLHDRQLQQAVPIPCGAGFGHELNDLRESPSQAGQEVGGGDSGTAAASSPGVSSVTAYT
jgi:hypothetical protein